MKNSYASTAPIFTKFACKVEMIIQSISRLSMFLVDDDLGQKIGKIRYHDSKKFKFSKNVNSENCLVFQLII